ncbi:TonB-dependent receptor [Roseibium algae]|uniref:TonB-dependent receptor n=1 Tax=Roseibium algae TaxID=3123038 RepID=A0ABU8TQW4_9HYPH
MAKLGRVDTQKMRARMRRCALLASTMLIVNCAMPAVYSSSAFAQSAEHSISIPAGPLTPALNDLAAQTGLQIIFDASLANGKTTQGVRGTVTPDEALNTLLANTGVSASFAGNDQVALESEDGIASTGNDTVLDTIYVYGARDAKTLEDTSASVGVVTSDDIEYGQMQYLPQALRRLANVEKGGTQNTGIVIRGMNFEGFSPAGAPMGSIYVDGILQSRYNSRFGARSLWDAEQVEVYRGPQSTLSGRAATAGAVYVKTKDPTFEKEMMASATVGNKNLAGGAFVINAPLSESDGLALRVAGSYEQKTVELDYPSYQDYANYDDFRTELSGTFRAKLLFAPDELPDTSTLFTYSYSKDRPNERLADPGPGTPGDFYLFPTFAEYREIEVHNVGLEVTHDISPALVFTSQTSLSHGITGRQSVDDGTENYINAFHGTYKDTLFSQELRLNYDLGQWSAIAGLYGSYEYQDSDFFARLTQWGIEQEQLYYRRTTNLAAFGEATYEFVPSWKITLGGRVDYLKEKTNESDATYGIGSTPPSPTLSGGDTNEFNIVPKIGISKQINIDHVAGFTFSQGFRTGGYYTDPFTSESKSYEAEYANNYELFYKGKFLDERLRLNANVFFTQYADQQVETSVVQGTTRGTIVNNAASSYAMGFEIEPTFAVNRNLSVFTSIGYLHTEFDKFDHNTYGDLTGEAFPEAPEWTVAFGGLYTFDNGVYIGGDAKFISDYNSKFSTNAPLDRIDSRFLVNAQAGIKRDNWEINAFAENLLDEEYFTMTELDGSPAFGQVGTSRLFGLNFKAKF